jgi:alpha-beta hydrolase superfamily lysophospholipase
MVSDIVLYRDYITFINEGKARYDAALPVFILGKSMGGLFALTFTLIHSD